MPIPPPAERLLSKSRFLAGLQCHKLLWWQLHEPDAPELVTTPDQEARFKAGERVGAVARDYVPGGELIGFRHWEIAQKLAATERALARGVPTLYEAAVSNGRAYAALDILERTPGGDRVIEVKSSTSVKKEHVAEVAFQVHLARARGLDVRAGLVMHLNRECRHPDLTNLFTHTDVTERLDVWLPQIDALVAEQRAMLAGPLPFVPIGEHCFSPYLCPFFARCWPEMGPEHVGSLYTMRRRAPALLEKGWITIHDLPSDFRLSEIQRRQIRALKEGRRIVEPELAQAFGGLNGGRLAYLDFETVGPAIPVWPGCRPWENVPVQFSVHAETGDGRLEHHEWLADGPGDPRPQQAERLLDACRGATAVVAYYASFERDCIRTLAAGAPHLAAELGELELKLVDLLPLVRNHIYDPAFHGSFSLKKVLPVLVPELTYADLEIADGAAATLELWKLVFEPGSYRPSRRAQVRAALLQYCKRDTWAMVKLLERLREIAAAAVAPPPPPPPPVVVTGKRRALAVQLDFGL
jgi:predicted RecB family nuclease